MNLVVAVKTKIANALRELYKIEATPENVPVQLTKPEFEGDYTLVLFGYVKELKKSPEALGEEIAVYLHAQEDHFFTYSEVVKGFFNFSISDEKWRSFLDANYANERFGFAEKTGKKVVVEYASPNTNKPIRLGHLRNIFIGWSVSEILKANGHEVYKTCIVNDRGIHICKSMIAWQQFANGETPESSGKKGDHLVGDYYVKFNDEYQKQIEELIASGLEKKEAEKQAPIMLGTQEMLLDWENGKEDVIGLWKKMNAWVYAGFDATYNRIGIGFDKTYYESDTYLEGKKFVASGLENQVFYKKADDSVWVDLRDEGLDEKLVLRKDGTSVYITQDLGLADEKFQDFGYDTSIYIIADEQNYHMKVLKLILQKLHKPYAAGILHLSYGMVELPEGKMKSREGTVVDADNMLEEMHEIARKKTSEQGKVNSSDYTPQELQELYETLGQGALKFFLLKVDTKKRIIFNPEESIDLQGFTATFIQYAYARIRSILNSNEATITAKVATNEALLPKEKELLVLLNQYPEILAQAGLEYNPSLVANFAFSVAQSFNSFYAVHKVLKAETEAKQLLRLKIIQLTANTIKSCMRLLGIQVPERM